MTCVLSNTKKWFDIARPNSNDKDRTTQLGVHVEEFGEMLESLKGETPLARANLAEALEAVKELAHHLKVCGDQYDVEDPLALLDSLSDQIVTATGVAHTQDMDIIGAVNEVNGSNFSKFDDEGKPIYDANKKVIKGPHYYKPELAGFLPE